jgi:flagellar biogenesis protein FliO
MSASSFTVNNGIRWIVLAVMLFVAGPSARASRPLTSQPQNAAPAAVVSQPVATSDVSLWRSLGALLLVLAALLGVSRFVRDRGMTVLGSRTDRRVRIIEKLPMDQRRCLMLVAMDDEELLLGVGADGITSLHRKDRKPAAGSAP